MGENDELDHEDNTSIIIIIHWNQQGTSGSPRLGRPYTEQTIQLQHEEEEGARGLEMKSLIVVVVLLVYVKQKHTKNLILITRRFLLDS